MIWRHLPRPGRALQLLVSWARRRMPLRVCPEISVPNAPSRSRLRCAFRAATVRERLEPIDTHCDRWAIVQHGERGIKAPGSQVPFTDTRVGRRSLMRVSTEGSGDGLTGSEYRISPRKFLTSGEATGTEYRFGPLSRPGRLALTSFLTLSAADQPDLPLAMYGEWNATCVMGGDRFR